jgi:hypothetical protein
VAILTLLSISAMVVATTTLLGLHLGIAGIILGSALALICPGLALTAAAGGWRTLSGPEVAVLSIGLSLVTVILGGVLLNESGVDLQAGWWAFIPAVVTLGASLVAVVRRGRGAERMSASGRSWPRPLTVAMLGAAAGIIGLAVWIALAPAPPQALEGYTQLWIRPGQDPEGDQVVLGVRSMELTRSMYTLWLEVDGSPVRDWGPVVLEPGQTWEATATLPTSRAETNAVIARLYRLDDTDRVYRWVAMRGGA